MWLLTRNKKKNKYYIKCVCVVKEQEMLSVTLEKLLDYVLKCAHTFTLRIFFTPLQSSKVNHICELTNTQRLGGIPTSRCFTLQSVGRGTCLCIALVAGKHTGGLVAGGAQRIGALHGSSCGTRQLRTANRCEWQNQSKKHVTEGAITVKKIIFWVWLLRIKAIVLFTIHCFVIRLNSRSHVGGSSDHFFEAVHLRGLDILSWYPPSQEYSHEEL